MKLANRQDYYVWGRVAPEDASARLTHQHYLCTRLFGWLLHPAITSHLSKESLTHKRLIADIGCGNGIWVTELAMTLSDQDTQIVGFDIQTDLFPQEKNWSPNTEFRLWDAFDRLPKEYEGSFDVVNIRLIFGAVANGDPRPVLQNLIKMLRPGGYIQWLEYDFDNPVVAQGSRWSQMREFFTLCRNMHSNQWVVELDNILESQGMEEIVLQKVLPPKEMLKFWQDNWYVSIRELVRGVGNAQVDELWNACDAEKVRIGFCPIQTPIILVFGRKSG